MPQNITLSFADTSGDVQLFGAGTSDNTETIYYEVETHEEEFGNRASLKKISNQIGILGNFGVTSQLQAYQDGEGPKPIPMTITKRVNIGKDINLEGHFFSFRWFGQTSTDSPIFSGIVIEDISDMGVTYS